MRRPINTPVGIWHIDKRRWEWLLFDECDVKLATESHAGRVPRLLLAHVSSRMTGAAGAGEWNPDDLLIEARRAVAELKGA